MNFTKKQLAEIRQNVAYKMGRTDFEFRVIEQIHVPRLLPGLTPKLTGNFQWGVWIKLADDTDLVYVRV